MSETLSFVSDEDGAYVVSVGNATVASGSCLAGVTTTVSIPFADFVVGDNLVTVNVTNANGAGVATVIVTDQATPPPGGGGGGGSTNLCWAGPMLDSMPREEYGADKIANRLNSFMRQPLVAVDVFILQSGAVVTDWVFPLDPIRVALWGASSGQHVSPADAELLIAAGYASNLVTCPPGGKAWDTGGWDTGPWDD